MSYLNRLRDISVADVVTLMEKDQAYGGSWKKRGGVGAFMMAARKWDRLEEQVQRYAWDIFAAAEDDARPEGILDDIQDLRRYLMLIEAEILERSECDVQAKKKVTEEERASPKPAAARVATEIDTFTEACAKRGVNPYAPDMDLPNDLLDLKYPGRLKRVPKE